MTHNHTDTTDKARIDFSNALRTMAIQRLKDAREHLIAEGIMHAAVFGSVARGEALPESDVDILVDLDPKAQIGLFRFVGLQQLLASIMERNVDLVTRRSLRPGRPDSILEDAIEVF